MIHVAIKNLDLHTLNVENIQIFKQLSHKEHIIVYETL